MTATVLFLPSELTRDARQSDRLYLYGWKQEGALVVGGALQAASTDGARSRLASSAAAAQSGCTIIGSVTETHNGAASQGLELEVVLSENKGTTLSWSRQPVTTLVQFTRPRPERLRFLSLEPLPLDVDEAFADKGEQKELQRESKMEQQLEAALNADFLRQPRDDGVDLTRVIDQINLAAQIDLQLRGASSLRIYMHERAIAPLIAVLLLPVNVLAGAGHALSATLNHRSALTRRTALKDVSLALQQVDTRLAQALSWPAQYAYIRRGTAPPVAGGPSVTAQLSVQRSLYIHFYNTLWLIANDLIVGTALSAFICENAASIGALLERLLQAYSIDYIRDTLLWLNEWPGGIKLDFEVAKVFCDAFLSLSGIWERYVFGALAPHLPTLVYVLGLTACLGSTMCLSLAADLLSLLTLHVYLFYFGATMVFSAHTSVLGALFRLFRGKRYNVLRGRTENATYRFDQLLLGTILFLLAAFLFPTVLVYYLAISAFRLGIVLAHASLESALAFLNHFPLFAVMLSFSDPGRLPGGIWFEPNLRDGELPCLQLKSQTVPAVAIFFQHIQLSRRLASHYSPLFLLTRVLTGQVISPIPRGRLRYGSVVTPDSI